MSHSVHGRSAFGAGSAFGGGGGVCVWREGICMARGMCGSGHTWHRGMRRRGNMNGSGRGHSWQGTSVAGREGTCVKNAS